MEGLYLKKCDGGVRAFSGQTGNTLWTFSTTNYSKKAKFFALGYSVVGTPAIADTDGDNKLEVAFGSFDRHFYLLNYDGSVRWRYEAADTVWSSGAFADANNNGKLDVIFGTDISQNKRIKPATKNGGMVYAIRPDSVKSKRIYFRDPRKKSVIWKLYGSKQIIQSSPSVGDVLASNPGDEVVVSTGCFFPENKKVKDGKEVIVISLTDGRVLARLPIQACNSNSVALADLNDDGFEEIVAIENGNKSFGGSGRSKVTVWDLNQSLSPLWSTIPEVGGKSRSSIEFGEPIVADLDSNGSLEVIVANSAGVAVLNGVDGVQLTCAEGNCPSGPMDIRTDAILKSVPTVADIDNDGVLELIASGSAGSRGALYVWTAFDADLGSSAGSGTVGQIAWGMRGKNSMHTRR